MKSTKTVFTIAFKAISFAWRTNRSLFVLLIILNLFLGSIVYLQFTSFSNIVDEIIAIKQGSGTTQALIASSVILGLSFLIPSILGNFSSYNRNKFRLHQDRQLDLYKIEMQSNLDIGTIESSYYQNLLRSAQEWGTGSVLNLQDFVLSSANNFAGITTSMIILWSINGWLVVFALCAAAPVYFFYKKYSLEVFRIRYFSIDDHRIISNRISHFEELQKAVDVILLKLKSWLKNQVGSLMGSYNEKIIHAEKRKSISYSFLSLWYLLFLFSAIALVTFQTLEGGVAVGGLLLAFNTYTRFYQTVNACVESISYTEEAARYAGRWFELFELKSHISNNLEAPPVQYDAPPHIEFQDVSFRYPGDENNPFVLQNISFVIRPGEKVAIVGVNGSGKTTLIKLLCRVYDPTSGSILVNGVDLRDVRIEDWHNAIGILFQDFPVYNLTIRESIGVGRVPQNGVPQTASEADLKKAAQFSGADEFIDSYDQLIWKEFKGGIDLSKGQHQRLAVARMFFRNAQITILDEPTASIDAVTEEKIFTSLEKNMEGKTVILITHRFSTVKNADTILMLEHGKVIEQGSHRDLLRRDEKYAELYHMQARRYQEDAS